jgi:hypothetical protein
VLFFTQSFVSSLQLLELKARELSSAQASLVLANQELANLRRQAAEDKITIEDLSTTASQAPFELDQREASLVKAPSSVKASVIQDLASGTSLALEQLVPFTSLTDEKLPDKFATDAHVPLLLGAIAVATRLLISESNICGALSMLNHLQDIAQQACELGSWTLALTYHNAKLRSLSHGDLAFSELAAHQPRAYSTALAARQQQSHPPSRAASQQRTASPKAKKDFYIPKSSLLMPDNKREVCLLFQSRQCSGGCGRVHACALCKKEYVPAIGICSIRGTDTVSSPHPFSSPPCYLSQGFARSLRQVT